MYIVKIDTVGKWSGQRVAKEVTRQRATKKHKARFRVILANDTKIFVDHVDIIEEIKN